MKKTTFILFLFLFVQMGFNLVSAITVPESDKVYTIKHEAGMYLTRSMGGDAPVIKMPTAGNDQQFQFIEVSNEGTYKIYNILCAGYDEYLARKDAGNNWPMFWVADPNKSANWSQSTADESDRVKNAQFQLIAKTDTDGSNYFVIKNIANNAYLGVDNTGDGGVVYIDKSETNSKWYIAEATGEVDKSALQKKYDEALSLYEGTVAGSGSDQYPVDTRNALKTVLDAAKAVLDDAGAFVEDVNDALIELIAALDDYRDSVYPFQPSTNAIYYIQHSSGLYFSLGVNLSNATYATDQQFQFVSVGNNYYNIKSVNSNEYLTRDENGWSLIWATDAASSTAHFILKSTGTGYYTIKCAALTGGKTEPFQFMGTDKNIAGEGVYIDKDGKDGKHYWKIVDITKLGVVKTALEDAVAKVNEFLQYATKGDGSDQYPAAEYDALVAANTSAQAILDRANATQSEVSDATIALNNALAECVAVVKPFNPDVTKDYSIVHFGGLFFNAIDLEEGSKDNAIDLATDSKLDNQKIKFVATDVADAYNITVASVSGKYLTRCTDPHATEAEKFDDYKLIWADDATSPYAKFEIKRTGNRDYYTIECITVGPQRTTSFLGTDNTDEATGVFVDKNGTSTNHYWRIGEFGTINSTKVVNANDVFVYSNSGMLKIAKLEGSNNVSIYSTIGQLISTAASTSSEYEKQLPNGIYVVVVSGETPYRGITVVK